MLTLAAFLLHRERVKLLTNQAYALCVLLRMRRRRGGGHNVTRAHTMTVTSLTGFVSMLHVLHTIAHALLERRRWRRPL